MNTKHGSVYNEMLLVFAAAVLPFILLGTCVLFISNAKLHRELMDKERTATHNSIIRLNESLENIYRSNFLLFNQSNVLKLSNRVSQLSDYEKMLAVNSIREQLTSINSANTLTQYMRIYFRDWERVYNCDGYPKGSFQKITEPEYNQLVKQIQGNKTYHVHDGLISILITDNPLYSPASVIEASLSVSALKAHFDALTQDTEGYYLLSAGEGEFRLDNLPPELASYIYSLLDAPTLEDGKIKLNGISYSIFYEQLPYIDGHFIRLISLKTLLAPLQILTAFTIVFLLLVFAGYIVFLVITKRLIRNPLSALVAGLSEVERGNYAVQIPYNTKNEFSYLYRGFNKMAMNINQSIERDYKMRLLLQQAELRQLQAQINPHFLYNSFFMLQRYIKCGLNEDAIEVTELLGRYFRYITKNAEDLVPLKEEYEHARIYSQIQEIRFEDRISVQFEELPSPFTDLRVPKLILQPVIENAYKYGLADRLSDGLLWIRFVSEGVKLYIYVEDNGENMTDEDITVLQNRLEAAQSGLLVEMSGILNICRRLAIFSDNQGTLQVARSSLGGLSVCITLERI